MSLFETALSSGLSWLGVHESNKVNAAIGRENIEAAAKENQLNRDFQERMSNTAYQRARVDLERAGFNPMLAVTNGSASTPSGSASVGHAEANQRNPYEGFRLGIDDTISTALNVYGRLRELDMAKSRTDADIAKTKADTIKSLKEGESIDPEVRKQNERTANSPLGKASIDLTRMLDGTIDGMRRAFSNSATQDKTITKEFKTIIKNITNNHLYNSDTTRRLNDSMEKMPKLR